MDTLIILNKYEQNNKKLLLVGDKSMIGMHLRQPRFTYSTCGLFTKNKERIQKFKFKETGNSRCIYQKELDKLVFNKTWLIEILRSKIYKYLTLTSKNVYIDKLVDIVNKYNNTYHSTIKMKPFDVKSTTYIEFNR